MRFLINAMERYESVSGSTFPRTSTRALKILSTRFWRAARDSFGDPRAGARSSPQVSAWPARCMGRRVQMTNVTWAVDGDSLERQLGTKHVVVLNDLEATGYSLALLEPDQLWSRSTPAHPRAMRRKR